MSALAGRRIGFVGLGLMGQPMARNLAAAGAVMTVSSRSPGPVAELAAEGMTAAACPRELAEACDDIVICVTDTPAVDAVLHGADGLLAGLRPGTLVIDMGTTQVAETRAWAAEVEAAGGLYVDAPVSGGQVGAQAGNLTIMAGGTEDAFARARPLLGVLGEKITHMGSTGAGQVTKAANQVIVALTIGAVAEGLALAKHCGVDPAKVREALAGGFASSRILELHGRRMAEGDFTPGGRAVVQRKDVIQGLELARQAGLELPGLAFNRTLWDRMIDEKGWGDLDHSALFKLIDEG
jgi:3-hydroxyisobutyrate dehydrogenase-like beta-hydroxyacid dehydrogenase